MDPNATLAEMLKLADVVLDDSNDFGGEATMDDARTLAEHVKNLHEWLTRGGFPPAAWTVAAFAIKE